MSACMLLLPQQALSGCDVEALCAQTAAWSILLLLLLMKCKIVSHLGNLPLSWTVWANCCIVWQQLNMALDGVAIKYSKQGGSPAMNLCKHAGVHQAGGHQGAL